MKKRASDRGKDKFLAKILGFFGVLIFSTDFRLVFFFIFGSFHEEFFKVFFFLDFGIFLGFWDIFKKISLDSVKKFSSCLPLDFFSGLGDFFGT